MPNPSKPSPSSTKHSWLKQRLASVMKARCVGKLINLQPLLHRLFPNIQYTTTQDLEFYALLKELKSNINNLSSREKDLMGNFLQFRHKIIADAMIPRSDVVAVKENVSLEELNRIIVQQSHTRILVYRDTLDSIIGFIHIKDLFKVITEKQPFKLHKLTRKAIITAHSMKLSDLLSEMQKKHTHIAIVIDEYGGTDGIVTIEDVMEVIVGTINDEHDNQPENEHYQIIDKETILCNARVEVEVIESLLKVNLKNESDEFDTIGGLILAKVGSVPSSGTKVDISDQIEIEVTDASPRVLKQVKIKLKNEESLLTRAKP